MMLRVLSRPARPPRPSRRCPSQRVVGGGAIVAPGREWPGSVIVVDDIWTSVAVYSERISAEAIRAVLAGEGLPCYIASDEHVPGLGSAFSVRVPGSLLRRARSLVEPGDVSDSELTELALKEPPDGSTGG